MNREQFGAYLKRFNSEDATVFDDYLSSRFRMLNGSLAFEGRQGMKAHYCDRIWPFFVERVNILRFVSDTDHLAIHAWTHFTSKGDFPETLFGPVKEGDAFDYRGVILYDIEAGQFTNIIVAYNSFSHTPLHKEPLEMGIPH